MHICTWTHAHTYIYTVYMLAAGFNPSSTYIIYFILSIITVNLGLLLKKQKKN